MSTTKVKLCEGKTTTKPVKLTKKSFNIMEPDEYYWEEEKQKLIKDNEKLASILKDAYIPSQIQDLVGVK